MVSKLSRIAKNWRVLIVIAAVAIAFLAVMGFPPEFSRDGVVIRTVEKGSPAYDAGITSSGSLTSRERITSVGGEKIGEPADFARATSGLEANQSVLVQTNKRLYKLKAAESGLGITVSKVPRTNIRTGLDLQGGTRVLLQPEEKLSQDDMQLLIANMNRRLNLFGLSDVIVRDASDFGGNQYIMVEVAGVNEQEMKDLVSRQGKFEAKVGNLSVFKGNDVVDVCRSAQCSGINPQVGCQQVSGSGWACGFYFTIGLSQEAAERQANATKGLAVIDDYLSEKLYLYLDDEQVDELNIGKSLKGVPSVSIQISGSGAGATQNDATKDAVQNMKQLQTILITGSLPVKLGIERTDVVSPLLGEQFTRNALLTGLIAVLAVVAILLIAYRKIAIAIPIMLTSMLEIFLLLGAAALIGWNIDLAGIAGIIAAVGTGVNDQIIITDEAMRGAVKGTRSWKESLKNAFGVIFGAYVTLLFAMLPLFVIGAGLLRGFAVTTIIGMSVGVFITRPAYAKIIEILMEKE